MSKATFHTLLPLLLVALMIAPVAIAKEDVVPAFEPKQTFDVEPVNLPEVNRKTLDNGLTVYTIPDDELPAVSIRLVFPSGGLFTPLDKPGLTSFMTDMLTQGTETRTAQEIAEAMDFIGGTLRSGSGDNGTQVFAGVLKRDIDLAFELISDVARRPTFPEEEVERLRMQYVSNLMSRVDDPNAIANEQWNLWVYGDHPYGLPGGGTIESIQALTRDNLVEHHQKLFTPDGAVLIIAGSVEPKRAVELAKQYFGDWKAAPKPERPAGDPSEGEGRQILLIDKPDAVQSEVRMGYLLAPYNMGDDMYAFKLMDYIYGGGGFQSRLMNRIRNELGLTYGIYSGLDARQYKGAYTIEGSTKNESAGEMVGETIRLMQAVIDSGFTKEELRDAKAYMLGSYPRQFETPQQVARQWQSALLFDLGDGDPADYIAGYRKKMAAVELQDVNQAAEKSLDPSKIRVVVVGNAEIVKPQLEEFGDVTVKSIDEFKAQL